MGGEDHSWLKSGGSLDTESVRQHYDAWADDYDATLALWNYRAPSEAAAMLKPLIPADAAILDFGAGTGLSGQAVRDAGFTGRLDGCDVSPRSVEIARGRGVYSDVQVVDGNAVPLPYASDSYDAAISIGVLTYIADVEALLRELARATKPGGYVLVTHREDLARDQDFAGLAARLPALGRPGRLAGLGGRCRCRHPERAAPGLPGQDQRGPLRPGRKHDRRTVLQRDDSRPHRGDAPREGREPHVRQPGRPKLQEDVERVGPRTADIFERGGVRRPEQ